MRLGVSAIAWDVEEDAAVAELLQQQGVDAVDIAPGKYFPDVLRTRPAEVRSVAAQWRRHGIELTGMQALLFGTQGLNLFGSDESRQRMSAHLAAVLRIAGELRATRLVFGSPRNRDRGALSAAEAQLQAAAFFLPLADIAAREGVLLCLEPNPAHYACNFMTDSPSTAAVVQAVNHPNIRMQLDIGALALNGEQADDVLRQHHVLVGHVHASEPDLLPLGDGASDHVGAAAALRRHRPGSLVMIEMVATRTEPHLQAITRALAFAARHYGNAA